MLLKLDFEWKILPNDGHNHGISFQNHDTFLNFQKGQGRPPLSSLVARLSVVEYALTSLNMPKYPWKCLNKLFWLCQSSEICLVTIHVHQALEDASGFKYARVHNIAQLYMQGLPRVLNLSDYDSICLRKAWICLNMP